MEIPKIHEGEYRFCLIMWEHAPISAAQLAKLTATGDWQPGQRFPYGADAQEIRTWVASLGL